MRHSTLDMGLSSAEIIARRLPVIWSGMLNPTARTQSEMTRMVVEKRSAAIASARAAGRAAAQGKPPADVALAAIKPVRARTKSNAARLTRRGPSGPQA